MRNQQPHKTDIAGDGHRCSHQQGYAKNDQAAATNDGQPQALGHLLAKAQGHQQVPLAPDQYTANDQCRQQKNQMTQAALGNRPQQPEH